MGAALRCLGLVKQSVDLGIGSHGSKLSCGDHLWKVQSGIVDNFRSFGMSVHNSRHNLRFRVDDFARIRCDDAVIAFACGYSSHRLDVFAVCKGSECLDSATGWMNLASHRPLSVRIHPAAGCFCLFTGDGASRFPIGWMILMFESPLKVLILPFTG